MRVGELKETLKPDLKVISRVATDVPTSEQMYVQSQDPEPVFTIDGDDGLFLTGPAEILAPEKQAEWEKAAEANPHFMYLKGRFVEGDSVNRNKAMWTTKDLELAQPTVAHGPLNWIHDEKHIVGVLTDSQMVYRETADDINNHIVATSTVWKFIYPNEAAAIEKASANRQLWYSMECVADTVTCIDGPGHPGCGESFPYRDVLREPAKICNHLRERSSIRRFNSPTFLGGAVIIPPVMPGWGKADATVMRQAAHVTEESGLTDVLDKKDAEAMVAMVIGYANGKI
jgi:hypothetical protein